MPNERGEKTLEDIMNAGPVHVAVVSSNQADTNNNVSGKKGVDSKLDEPSRFGRFGWYEFEKCFVPYIFRSEQKEKYVCLRMLESKLLSKFTNVLPQEINQVAVSGLKLDGNFQTFSVTQSEARLLNEVNHKHCDSGFGRVTFTKKDFVIRLEDAKEIHAFFQTCYKKTVLKISTRMDRCGFYRIDGKRTIPFTRCQTTKTRYIPLFYFQGGVERMKSNQIITLKGWDVAYLKLCCVVQGVKPDLFAEEALKVAKFEDIGSYLPEFTVFEEYWPGPNIESWEKVAEGGPEVSNEKVLDVLDKVLNSAKQRGKNDSSGDGSEYEPPSDWEK